MLLSTHSVHKKREILSPSLFVLRAYRPKGSSKLNIFRRRNHRKVDDMLSFSKLRQNYPNRKVPCIVALLLPCPSLMLLLPRRFPSFTLVKEDHRKGFALDIFLSLLPDSLTCENTSLASAYSGASCKCTSLCGPSSSATRTKPVNMGCGTCVILAGRWITVLPRSHLC